ncbi:MULTISPECIES: type IV secretion system protein VirB10 [unclassified Bartonella]|uniref:type IV secretion system protein VirB10 n=1 Tax=unclassified Bartonella TaxID=2645622 RepID=UPI002360E0B7|nr:type IV secretion system protein VirB10 [Bartonella sp. AU15XJBT]
MSDKPIIEDRGSIEGGRNNTSKSDPKKIIIIIAFVGFCAYVLWNIFSTAPTPKDTANIHKKQDFNNSVAPLELVSAESQAKIAPITLPSPTDPPEKTVEHDPLLDAAQRSPVLAFTSNTPPSSTQMPRNNYSNNINETPNNDSQNFSSLLKPTKIEGTRAGLMGNRNFIIAMGTSIPCILETALNSDQPGFASCIINRDILSDNGRVVLLDKGTQVVGEYRGGLKKGQSRLFVLWTRAKTPTGVIINLASPATDSLGRAGFDGNVNTHWWERFSSALLLTVVDSVTTNLTNKKKGNSNSGGGFNSSEASNIGKDTATVALENQINIPPTLEKFQGELVNIFVARDLDFSSVYKLVVTSKRYHSTPSYSFFH